MGGSGVSSGGPGVTAPPIRVAVVDDQSLIRSGLTMLIGSQPDLRVVAEAGDGEQALSLLARTPADVVLMDVRMPRLDGLEATRRLLAGPAPVPRVVMLTTFDLDEYVLAAIRVGASGFLLKDADPEQLLDAIRVVHRGDAVIAPGMTRRLLDHVAPLLGAPPAAPDTDLARRIAALSAREHEVFLLMAAARSNSEIATELFLSETTVKTHVAHVLDKLGARDRVQAAVLAYEAGVVTPGERIAVIDPPPAPGPGGHGAQLGPAGQGRP